ncbi:MAG: aminopeptidase P family protein [Alphaproteobacteria bacterium]|nr:aminopeptidase P family protein [Alphaproteobacteria bacterium]
MNDKTQTKIRIEQLQQWLRQENFDFFLLPRSDQYGQEFLPSCNERIAWLTGFTGSSGFVVISPSECVLFSDKRYSIQMITQTPDNVTCHDGAGMTLEQYLQKMVPQNARIGFPQWQLSIQLQQKFADIISDNFATLHSILQNPIDLFWHHQSGQARPAMPLSLPHLLDENHCGLDASAKLTLLRQRLKQQNCDGNIISDLSMIAWLLNLRGSDIPYAPVNIAMLLVRHDDAHLLINLQKTTPSPEQSLTQYFAKHKITLHDLSSLNSFIEKSSGKTYLLDEQKTPYHVKLLCDQYQVKSHHHPQPLLRERAIKNKAEISAIKNAHIIDGVAMVKFLHWLEQQSETCEITIAEKLEQFRCQHDFYRGASFGTIAGFAEHGAIIHYRATQQSNHHRQQQDGTLLLLDSGGHYLNGTTDITRTIPYGMINNQQIKADYSLVLKAHISLAKQIFPHGTNGAQLDALCRAPLWNYQRNYPHGTGHGVGMYADVHEGPYHISPNADKAIEAGMLFSNEPGLYRTDKYGIRIENLIITQVLDLQPLKLPDNDDTWLKFDTITLCPLNLDLIDKNYLNNDDIEWLNDYHQTIWQQLSPYFTDDSLRQYLHHATRKLG